MKKQPLVTILSIITVLIAGLAIYFGLESSALRQELKAKGEAQAQLEESRALQHELRVADDLLMQGSYRKALEAYEAQEKQSELEDNSSIAMRVAVVRELMRLRYENKLAAIEKGQEVVIDSSQIETLAIQEQLLQTDSLNFVLEKAKVQLTSLKRQLREKSYGEYLTFSNSKGSKMHYVGQVTNGKANGFGVALLSTGSRYEGYWKDNQRHGQGKYFWTDGQYYEGAFVNDKRNGEGTYHWPNGEKYTGHWENDMRSGEGTFYGKDGKIMAKGYWKEDQLTDQPAIASAQ